MDIGVEYKRLGELDVSALSDCILAQATAAWTS